MDPLNRPVVCCSFIIVTFDMGVKCQFLQLSINSPINIFSQNLHEPIFCYMWAISDGLAVEIRIMRLRNESNHRL